MPGILTRRLGPFPGWVWAALAGGGFLVFMYVRNRNKAQGSQGSLTNNPAASAIPFVPSVTVTGIPPQNPSPPASNPPTPGSGPRNAIWVRPGGSIRAAPTAVPSSAITYTPMPGWTFIVDPNGVADPDPSNASGQWYRVLAPGNGGWAWSGDFTFTSSGASGSGGYGYAGATGYSTPIGGWTVGWQPFGAGGSGEGPAGSGAGSTVNRTGAPRRARRLFGGSGGGAAVNRTGARATRPLRRRTLSGR